MLRKNSLVQADSPYLPFGSQNDMTCAFPIMQGFKKASKWALICQSILFHFLKCLSLQILVESWRGPKLMITMLHWASRQAMSPILSSPVVRWVYLKFTQGHELLNWSTMLSIHDSLRPRCYKLSTTIESSGRNCFAVECLRFLSGLEKLEGS